VFGVDAFPVLVEVDVAFGLPHFTMVGLPDATVRESRDRVRSAIRNSGFEFPHHRITVNLAPADVRKAGSSFDLPIALGLLAASGPQFLNECIAVARRANYQIDKNEFGRFFDGISRFVKVRHNPEFVRGCSQITRDQRRFLLIVFKIKYFHAILPLQGFARLPDVPSPTWFRRRTASADGKLRQARQSAGDRDRQSR